MRKWEWQKLRMRELWIRFLGMEYGRIFTFYLTFDYGGGNSQTTGGYVLGNAKETHSRGVDFIKRIL